MDLLLESRILLLKLIISQEELLQLGIEELQGSLVLVDDGHVDLILEHALFLGLFACINESIAAGCGILQRVLSLWSSCVQGSAWCACLALFQGASSSQGCRRVCSARLEILGASIVSR